jgi:MraZ protein
MLQLLGEFECTMDSKFRIRLPSQLLKQLGERASFSFVVNKGFEKHLTLYPQEVWEKTVASFENLNPYDTDTRNFLRRFSNGATILETDNQERVLIPKRLAEYAGIQRDIILNAFKDKIEIWDALEYEKFMNDETVDVSELAQRVLGNRNE